MKRTLCLIVCLLVTYWQVESLHKSCPECCWQKAWAEWEPYNDKCRAEEAAQIQRERWERYEFRVVPVEKGKSGRDKSGKWVEE